MKRTLYWLGGIGAAAVLAFGLNQMREDSPRVIKSYTENGREIILLDHDGDLSTAEERVTKWKISGADDEFDPKTGKPIQEGYVERRDFALSVDRMGRKINKEVVVYDEDGRERRTTWFLEPRQRGLEIPDGPEIVSTPEVELSGYERIKEYFEKLDPSEFSVRAVDEQDYRGEKSFNVDFLSGDEDDENTMRVLHTKDEFSSVLIPTRVNGVYLNATISEYGKGAETIGWFYQGVEGGNMFSAIIEGDDLVLKEIGYENDPERHCNDPFAKKDTKNNHNLLHDFDDLEVGTRLPGLGRKAREIYEAFNQKAKEAVERRDKNE